MRSKKNIRATALFFMIVFSLSTVVGFACSVGLKMGFNSRSHCSSSAGKTAHKHSVQSSHSKKNGSHKHAHAAKVEKKSDCKTKKCCKKKVRELEQTDKSVRSVIIAPHPVFITSFVFAYFDITPLPTANGTKDIKQFVRSYHPPIRDIRIAIQSFQI